MCCSKTVYEFYVIEHRAFLPKIALKAQINFEGSDQKAFQGSETEKGHTAKELVIDDITVPCTI